MTLTVARKIGLLIAIALVGIGVVSGLMWKQVGDVFDAANFANINTVPSVRELDTAADAISDLREELWQSTNWGDLNAASKTALVQSMSANQRQAIEALNKYEKEDMDEPQALFVPDKAALETTRDVLTHYFEIKDKVLVLLQAGKVEEARALLVNDLPMSKKITPTLMNHRQLNMQFAETAANNALATRAWALTLCAGAAVAIFAILGGLGYAVARSIVAPLKLAVHAAETASRGDLTSVIEVVGTDETSKVLRALKDMNFSLSEIVAQVRESSATIVTGSAQIAAGNTDLSQRTEEQAASLEETAASMEQLTAAVKQNADNAQKGNALALHASTTASRGLEVVSRIVDTMEDISRSSAKIVDIIAVIEGIAFQTNILALNAAVEAARAGEEGRGFAVVAGEVRILAQRSAEAARQIKGLISESAACVDAGTSLVGDAGNTMNDVVQAVKRVTDLMGEVMSASAEQRTGIEQVNQAVTQMDEVTQRNAALVEEASAAAQSMAAQSRSMQERVAIFRIID